MTSKPDLNVPVEIRKIIVSHVYPPIPRRDWDWCAYFDGTEESGHYGWGPTRQAAIEDLISLEEEGA